MTNSRVGAQLGGDCLSKGATGHITGRPEASQAKR
jgi:hypothetical protein